MPGESHGIEEPGGSIGSQRIGHDLRDSACTHKKLYGASQVVLVAENPPASAGDVRDAIASPGQEDPLEEETATHSSILAWRIP